MKKTTENNKDLKSSDEENALIIHWSQWLKYDGYDKYDSIHILGVPLNFKATQVFLPAVHLANKGCRLKLKFDQYFHYLNYLNEIKDQIESLGLAFLPSDSSSMQGYELQFEFRGLPSAHDGVVWKSSCLYQSGAKSLFKRVFGHGVSDAFWHWKYPMHKLETSMVAVHEGKVIAHTGLIERNIVTHGLDFSANQVCDVMVDRKYRGSLLNSLLVKIIQLQLSCLNKSDVNTHYHKKYLVGYGFPHGRHKKLGGRLGIYKPTSGVYQVRLKAESIDSSKAMITQFSSLSNEFKSSWNKAWQAMKEKSSSFCIGERDWLYFLRRYWGHPEKNYSYYQINDSFYVLDEGLNNNKQDCKLIDFVGDIDDFFPNASLLISKLNLSSAEMWLIDWYFDIYKASYCFDISIDDAALVTNYPSGGDFEKYASAKWWIMMGDTDFM